MSRVGAVVLCAGSSTRFGRDKLMLRIGDKLVWQHSVEAFLRHPLIEWVGVVTSPDQLRVIRDDRLAFVIEGGRSRQESAAIGVRALPDAAETVLIHDGARPFVDQDLITRVIDGVDKYTAAIPVIEIADSVKLLLGNRVKDISREQVRAAQTPQGFRRRDYLAAAEEVIPFVTDDAGLLEKIGIRAAHVEGNRANMKLTTEDQYQVILNTLHQAETRTGLGYDIHAFSADPERKLFLGGVEFDHRPGLEGHSDADVLLHAITDALLGAAAYGDIGLLFPNTDPAYKDAPSRNFMEEAARRLAEGGWSVVNIDAVILAEFPKVMPRSEEIRKSIADMLKISPDRVSIKATTHEKLGAIGRGEGIAAQASAAITRTGPRTSA